MEEQSGAAFESRTAVHISPVGIRNKFTGNQETDTILQLLPANCQVLLLSRSRLSPYQKLTDHPACLNLPVAGFLGQVDFTVPPENRAAANEPK